jgi:hypothetical protein
VLRCLLRGLPLPRWGNLRRTRPFSEQFGFERGTPIDRYYSARFFERERHAITGRVLEIQGSGYTRRYGTALSATDSIDIDPASRPTFVCDLAHSEDIIPDAAYDCFLLPHTLSLLRDVEGCLRQALRIVKPGGTILATAGGFVPLTPDVDDYWHSTAAGWREVAARVWSGEDVEIEQHGNALAAVASIMGLAHEELTSEELGVNDPRYPVVVTLRCRRR